MDLPTKREGAFHTFRNGLETLVEAIEEKLDPNSVLKGVRVDSIERMENKNLLAIERWAENRSRCCHYDDRT